MATPEFAIGGLHGWRGALLGLAASGVFMVCGWQDLRPLRFGLSCVFWFLLAVVSGGGVVWLGVVEGNWGEALLGVAALCLDVWLINHWWRVRGTETQKKETKR
jgi:hypothetical protein